MKPKPRIAKVASQGKKNANQSCTEIGSLGIRKWENLVPSCET